MLKLYFKALKVIIGFINRFIYLGNKCKLTSEMLS